MGDSAASDATRLQNNKSENPDHVRAMEQLLQLVDSESRPNINALWNVAKNIDPISLNIKFFGYELAKQMSAALPKRVGLTARHIDFKSKCSTQADLESDWVAYWASELNLPVIFHRKLWEFAYVLQAIYQNGKMVPGTRGLGFGCGVEPIPSFLAGRGMEVVVTDLEPDRQEASGWQKSNEHTRSLDAAYHREFVDRATFNKSVSLRYVDMNAIPADLTGFDFCWSICAFEHLGSIRQGLDFIENSLKTLKPGGVSVHTTEFNFFHNDKTIDNWNTVLFQRRHFQEIHDRLTTQGHKVAPLDFDVGNKPLDKFIDIPPFVHDWPEHMRQAWGGGENNHLKLAIDGFPSTCFGLTVVKGG